MADHAEDRELCERWFVRRGLPHLIHDYSITGDVLTRASPFLGFVALVQLFLVFGERWRGWGQAAVFLIAAAAVAAVFAGINRMRGRRTWQLPERVGLIEIGAYLTLGTVFAGIGAQGSVIVDAVFVLVANLVLLVVAYLVTSWGLVPMIRWSTVQFWRQVGNVAVLFARSMPVLLLFSAFVFLNGEVWQVANDFTLPFYGLTAAILVLVGGSFVALSVRRLTLDLARFTAWGDIRPHCADTPVEAMAPGDDEPPPDHPDLSRRERLNVSLLLFVAQSIQIALVSLIVSAFYLVFGLFTIREKTILQWTTVSELTESADWVVRYSLFGDQVVVSRQLLLVAGFIGLVSGLQFAVSVLTDAGYRSELAQDMTEELRAALAVRAVYHRRLVD